MKTFLRKLYLRLFKPYKVLDMQLVDVKDANALIELDSRWCLSPVSYQTEEHLSNGMVWIEKRERVKE